MSSGSDGVEVEGTREVPTDEFVRTLFAGLHSPDNRLVRHAGYILCQTAHANADLRPGIITGLSEIAVRRQHHDPVLRTLATIGGQYEAMVKQALLTATDRRQARLIYERLTKIRTWEVSYERSEPAEKETLVDVGGSGMIRVPRRLLERESEETTTSTQSSSTRTAAQTHQDTRSPGQQRNWARLSRRERVERMPHGQQFAAIEELSRFDEFEFLGPEVETRYGHAVRAKTLAGTDEDIATVRLYRNHDRHGFTNALGQRISHWSRTHTPGVVGVQDWGHSPQPWVATEFTEQTLWERGKLDPAEGLKVARDLTGALAGIHQKDLLHGGIDPHSIRFTGSYFQERPEPMLENVGLISVYRHFDNPASYTDPRYGAPEYFDPRYGSIDHWTDIYQLGMAIYSAFTGDPPYEGNINEIQRQVLTDTPLGMSARNPDLPGSLALVLQKATAREKLKRFETTTQFHHAMCAVCDEILDE